MMWPSAGSTELMEMRNYCATVQFLPSPERLIHHDLLGRVLGGLLLLPPVCVGGVVVHVDHPNGEKRQNRIRDEEVVT